MNVFKSCPSSLFPPSHQLQLSATCHILYLVQPPALSNLTELYLPPSTVTTMSNNDTGKDTSSKSSGTAKIYYYCTRCNAPVFDDYAQGKDKGYLCIVCELPTAGTVDAGLTYRCLHAQGPRDRFQEVIAGALGRLETASHWQTHMNLHSALVFTKIH